MTEPNQYIIQHSMGLEIYVTKQRKSFVSVPFYKTHAVCYHEIVINYVGSRGIYYLTIHKKLIS